MSKKPTRKQLNKRIKKAFGHSTYLVFKFSRADALSQGLLICECGHMPNNHFQWEGKPCAFCPCKKYREIARVGKLVKRRRSTKTLHRKKRTS